MATDQVFPLTAALGRAGGKLHFYWVASSTNHTATLRLRRLSHDLSAEERSLLENYLHVGRLIDLMKSKARCSLQTA